MGCKTPIAVYYAKNIDPYLMDPGQYGKMQVLRKFRLTSVLPKDMQIVWQIVQVLETCLLRMEV